MRRTDRLFKDEFLKYLQNKVPDEQETGSSYVRNQYFELYLHIRNRIILW